MSMQVTVTLADDTYRRAEYLARLTGRDVGDVLAETIHRSLEPLGAPYPGERPVGELTDAEVLATADSQMDAEQNNRLNELLERQQAGTLTDEDRTALPALMQIYQDGLLRKAQALHEAVRRGLQPPLAS